MEQVLLLHKFLFGAYCTFRLFNSFLPADWTPACIDYHMYLRVLLVSIMTNS